MITRIQEDQIPADNTAGYTTIALFARGTVPTEPQLMMNKVVLVPIPHPTSPNCLAIEVADPDDASTRQRVKETIIKLWKLD